MSFLQTSANVTDNAEDFYGSEAPQVVAAEKVGADTTKLDDNSIKKGETLVRMDLVNVNVVREEQKMKDTAITKGERVSEREFVV